MNTLGLIALLCFYLTNTNYLSDYDMFFNFTDYTYIDVPVISDNNVEFGLETDTEYLTAYLAVMI